LNSMGSFKCDCRDGFVLTRDGKTCAGYCVIWFPVPCVHHVSLFIKIDLPTGSPNDIHIGAIQALITVSSNSSEVTFSQIILKHVSYW
jgi:hypothetical protein